MNGHVQFCKRCGSSVLGKRKTAPSGHALGINVHVLNLISRSKANYIPGKNVKRHNPLFSRREDLPRRWSRPAIHPTQISSTPESWARNANVQRKLSLWRGNDISGVQTTRWPRSYVLQLLVMLTCMPLPFHPPKIRNLKLTRHRMVNSTSIPTQAKSQSTPAPQY